LKLPERDWTTRYIEHLPEHFYNWGVRGGQPAPEVGLGFKVNV